MRAIIVGAGVAGLAAARILGARALLLEAACAPLAKLRLSGGARCNLSNAAIEPGRYKCSHEYYSAVLANACGAELCAEFAPLEFERIKDAQYFAKSADLVAEKLLTGCEAEVIYNCCVSDVARCEAGYLVSTNLGEFVTDCLIIACGSPAGWRNAAASQNRQCKIAAAQNRDAAVQNRRSAKSQKLTPNLPKNPAQWMFASNLALKIAQKFNIASKPFLPALCELALQPEQAAFAELAGLSLRARLKISQPASAAGKALESKHFKRDGELEIYNDLLFTHRGLGGPAAYQASLWWQKGAIECDFWPGRKLERSRLNLQAATGLPKRFCALFLGILGLKNQPLKAYSAAEFEHLRTNLHAFKFKIAGRALLAKAEVASGGIDCAAVLANGGTAAASELYRGLFFAGEVIDCTGALGGFNITHALLSGRFVAAQALKLLTKDANETK